MNASLLVFSVPTTPSCHVGSNGSRLFKVQKVKTLSHGLFEPVCCFFGSLSLLNFWSRYPAECSRDFLCKVLGWHHHKQSVSHRVHSVANKNQALTLKLTTSPMMTIFSPRMTYTPKGMSP